MWIEESRCPIIEIIFGGAQFCHLIAAYRPSQRINAQPECNDLDDTYGSTAVTVQKVQIGHYTHPWLSYLLAISLTYIKINFFKKNSKKNKKKQKKEKKKEEKKEKR